MSTKFSVINRPMKVFLFLRMTLVNRSIALIYLTDHNCFGGRVLFFWRDGLGGGGVWTILWGIQFFFSPLGFV